MLGPAPGTAYTAEALTEASQKLALPAGIDPSQAVVEVDNSTIVVQLTGVPKTDAQRVIDEIAEVSGRVLLRPVLQCAPAVGSTTGAPQPSTTTTVIVDDPAQSQLLPAGELQCLVGPAAGTAEVFESDATAEEIPGAGWGVTASLRPGATGEDVFNQIAAECFNTTAACPTGQLAIDYDGRVVSAPTINAAEFSGHVQIAGTFTEDQAKALASALSIGSLGLELQIQQSQIVG